MKQLFIIISILFFTNGYAQNELEAELLEINFLGESEPKNLIIFQNQIYFTANDGVHGRELWKIENDLPVLVMNIEEGSNDAFNDNCIFLVTNDFIYFTTTNGKKLWKSDGTEVGTELILSNIESEYPCFSNLIEFDSKIYFSYNDGIHGFELWQTDGSTNETSLVKDIYPGSNGSEIQDFFIFNDYLYFTAVNGSGTERREIWKSDGTEIGTTMLKDIGGQTYADGVKVGNDFLISGNYFYFYGYSNSAGYELWKSDGTESGTQMVKDINPGYSSSDYYNNILEGAVGNGYIVFKAYSPDSGYELWKSDGTESGTFKLKEINPDGGSYGDGISPYTGGRFTAYNDKIYFIGQQDLYKLWVTDGTSEGTYKFLDLNPGENESYDDFKVVNNNLYFFNSSKVVKTNGNTSEIFVNMEDEGGISKYLPQNDKVYFVKNYDDKNGLELWESKINNTDIKILEVNSTYGVNPRNFAIFGDKIVFFGHNYTYYEVPMISDGTPVGTKSILDNPPFRVDNNYAARLFQAGNNMFFMATNNQNNWELYKTDGTPEGTGLVKDLTGHGGQGLVKELYASYNNILYFVGNDYFHGNELYRSDGTEEGTYMVKNLSEGDYEGNPFNTYINSFMLKDDYLYFSGGLDDAPSYPYEGTVGIWRTDGTESGTELILQFEDSGLYDHGPHNLIAVNEKLFFTRNENNSSYGDHSLYVTQGTSDTTIKLGEWGGSWVLEQFSELNGKLIFDANKSEGHYENLYISDGTIEGTYEINENLSFEDILKTKKCGNQIYFSTGYTSQGESGIMWTTDGTSDGTTQISQNSVNLTTRATCINENLVFIDDENHYGNEIKITNGQTINNISVNYGDGESDEYEGITSLFANQNLLYFVIQTNKHGEELYVSNPEFILSTEEINEGLTKDNSKILIYPNPTSSEINVVSNDQSKIKQIQLYDLTGKLMEIGIYNSIELKLNLDKYNSGIYLLKVQTEKNTTTKKVIIK